MGDLVENYGVFLDGLRMLRTGSLVLVVAYVLIAVGSWGSVAALFSVVGFGLFSPALPAAILFLLVGLEVAGIVIGLIGVYGYVVPAYGRFKLFSGGFSAASSLVRVGLLGGLIAFLVSIALIFLLIAVAFSGGFGAAFITALIVFGLLVLAVILLIIGKVGLIVGSFKLRDVTGESVFIIAAVFFIISLVLDVVGAMFKPLLTASFFFSLISWVLTYVACGSAISEVRVKLNY